MPNTRSAAKRMRQDRHRRLRNLNAKSELKSLFRKFHRFLQEGQVEPARSLLPSLTRRIDQAASKGIVHRNAASRKKARLALRLAKSQPQAA